MRCARELSADPPDEGSAARMAIERRHQRDALFRPAGGGAFQPGVRSYCFYFAADARGDFVCRDAVRERDGAESSLEPRIAAPGSGCTAHGARACLFAVPGQGDCELLFREPGADYSGAVVCYFL